MRALQGMPLYLDTTVAFGEAKDERNIVGGQFGLASKEFTPAMAKAVFDNLTAEVRCTSHLSPPRANLAEPLACTDPSQPLRDRHQR